MKPLFLFLLLSVSPQLLFSQNQPESVVNFLYDTRGTFYPGKQYFMAAPVPDNILGQIYLDENWQEGAIISQEDQSGSAQVRYKVLLDEMQVLVDGKVMALTPAKIKAMRIGQKIFITSPFVAANGTMTIGFFELLAEGELELLKRYWCDTRPTEYHPAVATAKDVEYVIKEEYYYRWQKDYAKPLKRTKKNVLELFEGRWKEAADYAGKEKLNYKKAEDLAKFFMQYNQLEKSKKWN
jgi:hypothetical protein